jgi:lipoprotein-anchoring transpeptidase ErfK/SrfK
MRTIVVSLFLLLSAVSSASAGVVARVDVSKQTMTVSENGQVVYSWRVSTGRKGFNTPRGSYRPTRMHRMWYSRKYDNSPMPHSIFFRGGYAIHGTNYVKNLGRPASHGCVRLAPGNARALYDLVRAHGAGNTRIIVQN